MAAEQLQIQVSANVSNAVKGLNDLNKTLTTTNTAAVKTGTAGMNSLAKGSGQATAAITNFSRVASDAPFGLIGIANNIDPLIQSFVTLKKETGSTGGAFKALGASLAGGGGLILGVSLLTSALQFVELGLSRWGASAKKAKEEQDKLQEGQRQLVETTTKQRLEFESLVKISKDATQTELTRNKALERLNDILPDTIGKLNQQNIATAQGAEIIRNYIAAIEAKATAELLANRIAENNVKLFDQRNKSLENTRKIEADLTILRSRLSRIDINATGRAGEASALRYSSIQSEINNLVADKIKSDKESNKIISETNKLNEQLRLEYEKQLPLVNQLTDKTEKQGKKTNEITDILKKYREELSGISWDEQQKAIDLTNEKIKLASDTLKSLYLAGVKDTSNAWIQVQNDFNNFANLFIKRSVELSRTEIAPQFKEPVITLDLSTEDPFENYVQGAININTQIQILNKNFENINKLQKENNFYWNELKLTPEILKQIQQGIPIQQITEWAVKNNQILTQQKEIANFVSGSLSPAIDNMFNAISEGGDPFAALRASLDQLVVQLAAAITKALLLKAITSAIAPAGETAGGGGLFGIIRGDTLRGIFSR